MLYIHMIISILEDVKAEKCLMEIQEYIENTAFHVNYHFYYSIS